MLLPVKLKAISAAMQALVGVGIALACHAAAALDKRYYAGDLYMYERSERYESVLGGAVTYLRPTGHDEFEPVAGALLVEGVLSGETLVHLRRLLSSSHGFTVFLNSPGGDLLAGMELGRFLQERRARAVSNRGAQCKSACALAFLGAETRVLLGEPGAIGFHRQYRLIDRKVTYGDINADRKLIAAYLSVIEFKGVTAEEITSTTGDATFSASALAEREVITATEEERRLSYRKMLAYSGMTPFEAVSRLCAKYDQRPSAPGASLEVTAIMLICGGRIPASREPLLIASETLKGTSPDEDLILLDDDKIKKALRSNDRGAIHAFNQEYGRRDGTYTRWLERRRAIRERLGYASDEK